MLRTTANFVIWCLFFSIFFDDDVIYFSAFKITKVSQSRSILPLHIYSTFICAKTAFFLHFPLFIKLLHQNENLRWVRGMEDYLNATVVVFALFNSLHVNCVDASNKGEWLWCYGLESRMTAVMQNSEKTTFKPELCCECCIKEGKKKHWV